MSDETKKVEEAAQTTKEPKTIEKKEKPKTKAKAKTPKEPKEPKAPKKKEKRLTLPRYLRLAKGGMWKDMEGPYSSDAVVYSLDRIMVGKTPKFQEDGDGGFVQDNEGRLVQIDTDDEPPMDQFKNENIREYGYVEEKMPWYIDLAKIPKEKLGRIIIAYNAGVLVRADPKNPPVSKEKPVGKPTDWKMSSKVKGELVFNGTNKEMFKKLQGLNITKLKEFINECPVTEAGRDNLLDLLDYEERGLNSRSRPRLEVVNLIRSKLQKYGNGISALRRNDIINKAKEADKVKDHSKK